MSKPDSLETHLVRPRTPVERDVARLGPWFHNLHLPDGTQTAPDHPLGDFPAFKWRDVAPHIPEDLTGWRVLDVGCNAGFYTFQLALRGATVHAIDIGDRYLAQARWAARQFGVGERVTIERTEVYDLARRQGEYDLVMFLGVFYHLRYPLLGLDILARKTSRLMVFQSLTIPCRGQSEVPRDVDLNDRELLCDPAWPSMAFIEHSFAGDPTNWWAPNEAAVEALLRSSGLRITAVPGHEIYLCQPDEDAWSPRADWVSSQYDAATGIRPRDA